MVNVGIIGCGTWGRNHIRVLNNLAGATVAAVADTDSATLSRAQEMVRAVRCETEPRKLIEDPKLDALVIATPTSTHYQVAREALLANKHVLCEKPLCRTSAEGKELVELARARNQVLMVGHIFLFNAGIVKVKELIEQEKRL